MRVQFISANEIMNDFFVYILECSDGKLYVGHTDNLDRRLAEHSDGTCGGYTARRRPVKMVFSEPYQSRDEAFEVERQVKTWSRDKKLALIKKIGKSFRNWGRKNLSSPFFSIYPHTSLDTFASLRSANTRDEREGTRFLLLV